METGWLCIGLFLLGVISFICHLFWAGIARIAGFGQKKFPQLPPERDELAQVSRQMGELARANLIDAPTYQKVMEALQVARFRGMRQAVPPPLPVMPAADAKPAMPVAPLVAVPAASVFAGPLATAPVQGAVTSTPITPPPFPPRIIVPKPAPKPRRSISDLFAAFMRDSNIRWGELIGGMLIIGGSIALVVSFWSEIAHHSFVQFGVFTGVTAAMLGLGLYAEHRWKLPTTSRGILLIATLLTPLNFLAFAALSHGATPTAIETAIEAGALLLFGFLVWRGAAVLIPYWPNLLTTAVIGPSASLVLIQRLGVRQSVMATIALGALPVAIYCGVVALMLVRAARWRRIRAHAIEAIFMLLGVATFAAIASVGLLVFRAARPWDAAHVLSPLLSIATAPALACGLLIWSRITDRKLTGLRVAGTAIAVAAAIILVGAMALAWPDPAYLLPLAVADFIVLTGVALAFAFPVAHWIALPCALVGYLTAIQVFRGQVQWTSTPEKTLAAFLDPAGGAGLVGLFTCAAAFGLILRRLGRIADIRTYRQVALSIAMVSLALISRTAFDRAHAISTAALVYAFYAVAAFVAAVRLGWPGADWAGCALLIAACIQVALARTRVEHPWTVGLLAGATIEAVATLAIRKAQSLHSALGNALKWTATFAAAAAVTSLVSVATIGSARIVGGEMLWAAAIWLLIALVEGAEPIFIAGEVALGVGVAISVVGVLAKHTWFAQAQVPLLHPWTLEAIGAALAGIPLAVAIVRSALPSHWAVKRWLNSPWSVDRGLAIVLTAGLTIIVCVGAFDSIRIELAVRAIQRSPAWATGVTGYGSWILLAMLAATFSTWVAQRIEKRAILLLLWVILLGCPLVAMRWAEAGIAASVLRWLLATAGLIGSAVPWWRHRMPRPIRLELRNHNVTDFRAILVVMCAIPVIGLSIYPTGLALQGIRILGPEPHTFFARIGDATSYSIPLLLVAVWFLGHAIRERSGTWTCAATAVCNLTVTLAYALALTTGGHAWATPNTLHLVQLNVIVLGTFALGWICVRRVWHRRGALIERRAPALLTAQVALALVGLGIPLAMESAWLLLGPGNASNMTTLSDPLGWMALIASLAALIALYRWLSPGVVGIGAGTIALMIAFSAAHYDPTQWLSFHLQMCGVLAAAGVAFAAGIWEAVRRERIVTPVGEAVDSNIGPEPQANSPAIPLAYQSADPASTAIDHGVGAAYLYLAGSFSAWLVLLALRAAVSDPQAPWWSTSCTMTLSILWVAIACRTQSALLLYVGGLLPNLAATFWWIEKPWTGSHDLADLLCGNATVLATSGLAALVLDAQILRPSRRMHTFQLPFHRFALNVVALGLMLFGATSVFNASGFDVGAAAPITSIPALLVGAVLALATLGDGEAFALGQLYLIGLSAVAIIIQLLHPAGRHVEWAYEIGLCTFVALSGLLFSVRSAAARLMTAIGLPPVVSSSIVDMIRFFSAILASAGICLAIRQDFILPEFPLRLMAATAALLQLGGLGAMASEPRQISLRQVIVLLGIAGLVGWVWTWMPAGVSEPSALAAAALAGVSAGICIGATLYAAMRRSEKWSSWLAALRSVTGAVVVVWIAAGAAVVGFEISRALHGATIHLSRGWVITTLVIYLSGAAACVFLSLRSDEHDPIGIVPPLRGAYVYAAEILLAVAFCHLRLTMPWLFGGIISQYWPIIVMGIAFTGVGLGEVLGRRQLPTVSKPLSTTGVFLPLLPALAFSLAPSRVDYAVLLFLIGFFYAVLSVARKSFVFGVLAALSANGGLWSLLYRHPELRFMIHPQLWLVPGAVSVLVAAQLNRDRLSPAQLRFIRYACLMLVYVSSTSDIFLNGVRDHPYLPIILAILSVAGVMLGILFRVRAFLFLGASFLAIAIVTMIYFASVNLHWTWLWYVAVIALGAAIIVIFALFEKKRAEMLALVDGLKAWQ